MPILSAQSAHVSRRITSGLQHLRRLPSSWDSSRACSLRLSKLALLLLDVHSPLSQLRWLCRYGRSSYKHFTMISARV